MKIVRRVLQWILFVLTGRGPIADEAIQENILDLSGQSR